MKIQNHNVFMKNVWLYRTVCIFGIAGWVPMTYPAYKLGLFLLSILQSLYVTEHDMVPLPGMNTISWCGFI